MSKRKDAGEFEDKNFKKTKSSNFPEVEREPEMVTFAPDSFNQYNRSQKEQSVINFVKCANKSVKIL
jgi:hypothetical protein